MSTITISIDLKSPHFRPAPWPPRAASCSAATLGATASRAELNRTQNISKKQRELGDNYLDVYRGTECVRLKEGLGGTRSSVAHTNSHLALR